MDLHCLSMVELLALRQRISSEIKMRRIVDTANTMDHGQIEELIRQLQLVKNMPQHMPNKVAKQLA